MRIYVHERICLYTYVYMYTNFYMHVYAYTYMLTDCCANTVKNVKFFIMRSCVYNIIICTYAYVYMYMYTYLSPHAVWRGSRAGQRFRSKTYHTMLVGVLVAGRLSQHSLMSHKHIHTHMCEYLYLYLYVDEVTCDYVEACW